MSNGILSIKKKQPSLIAKKSKNILAYQLKNFTTPSVAFDLHVTLRYKTRDRYPIDSTEPTMVCKVTNLSYNYSK